MRLLVCEDVGEHHCVRCKLEITSERQLEHKSSSSSIPVTPASSRHKSTAGSAGHFQEFLWISFSCGRGRPFRYLLGQTLEWGWKALCPGVIGTCLAFSRPHIPDIVPSWQPLSATLLFEMGPKVENLVLNLIAPLFSSPFFVCSFHFRGNLKLWSSVLAGYFQVAMSIASSLLPVCKQRLWEVSFAQDSSSTFLAIQFKTYSYFYYFLNGL